MNQLDIKVLDDSMIEIDIKEFGQPTCLSLKQIETYCKLYDDFDKGLIINPFNLDVESTLFWGKILAEVLTTATEKIEMYKELGFYKVT